MKTQASNGFGQPAEEQLRLHVKRKLSLLMKISLHLWRHWQLTTSVNHFNEIFLRCPDPGCDWELSKTPGHSENWSSCSHLYSPGGYLHLSFSKHFNHNLHYISIIINFNYYISIISQSLHFNHNLHYISIIIYITFRVGTCTFPSQNISIIIYITFQS